MPSSLQLHREGEISEFGNMLELEQVDRDGAPHSSVESTSAPANKNKRTNMSDNMSREAQNSRRSNDDDERRISYSGIPQIVVEESQQLHEEQHYNREVQMTFVLTLGDGADTSTHVADEANGISSTDSSDTWTETTDLETSPSVSVLSHGDSSAESASFQNHLEGYPQTTITLRSPEPPLPQPGPSTSNENSSASASPSPPSSINASPALATADQALPAQLLDPRAAGVSYAGKLSPLMYIPPPPYAAQPPSYNAIGRSRSLASVSDLQRAADAAFALEMPPSYDAAVDADRPCVVRDLRRRRPESTGRWNSGSGRRCSLSCWAWNLAIIVIVLLVFAFYRNA